MSGLELFGTTEISEVVRFGHIEWREFYESEGKDLFNRWGDPDKVVKGGFCDQDGGRLAMTCERHVHDVSLKNIITTTW